MRNRAALSFSCLALLCACGRIAPGPGDGSSASNPGNPASQGDGGSSSSTERDRELSLDLQAADIAMDDEAVFVADENEDVHRVARADGTDTVIAKSDATFREIAVGGSDVYFAAGDDVVTGTPTAKSELVRVAKDGSSLETLRTSTSPDHGIQAVATDARALYWIEQSALWTMPLSSSDAERLADVPSAYGKIAAHGGYVYVTELDPTTYDFDVRRFDPKAPGTSVFYPNANASQSVAFFGDTLYVVDGMRGTTYDAPKGAGDPWSPGEGAFAVTASASAIYVTALNDSGGGGGGNALFRVDASNERVLVAKGGALGPSVMCADERAVAWTDNGTLHLTPLR